MEKFLIKKSLILKNSSSTQDKQDDYNSRPNSFIPQDSCIIIINFFYFLVMLYSSFVMNTLEKIPRATTKDNTLVP